MTELREKTDVMQDDGGVEDQKLLKIKWPFVHFILQIYMFIHTTRQKKNPQTHMEIFKFGGILLVRLKQGCIKLKELS